MASSSWRRFYPNEVDIIEHESTNATESDLPGPGRTLGKVYKNIGRRLEEFLNDLAERKGLGPSAVAIRIKNRVDEGRRQAINLKRYGQVLYTEKEMADQRKDLKKLIRHAKLLLNCIQEYLALTRCVLQIQD